MNQLNGELIKQQTKENHISMWKFSIKNSPSFVISTQAQCLQHSSSGVGTTFGICFELHFNCFGGLANTGHDGRHSTLPRSQKQCCSQPVKFTGMSLQLSKYCPLYSHVPLSTQRILSVQKNKCSQLIFVQSMSHGKYRKFAYSCRSKIIFFKKMLLVPAGAFISQKKLFPTENASLH